MEMNKQEAWLGIGSIVVILVCVYLLSLQNAEDNGAVAPSETPTTVPPMTEFTKKVFEASQGFQYLVSYDEYGFSPKKFSVRVGESVRFTNNSAAQLWISAHAVDGTDIHPGTGDSCGQSSFDSCYAMEPKEFWEFTFDEEGVWGYRNAAMPTHTATVTVKRDE